MDQDVSATMTSLARRSAWVPSATKAVAPRRQRRWLLRTASLALTGLALTDCVELGDPPPEMVEVYNLTNVDLRVAYRAEPPPGIGAAPPGILERQSFLLTAGEYHSFRPYPSSDLCTTAPIVASLADDGRQVARLAPPVCFSESNTWKITQDMID